MKKLLITAGILLLAAVFMSGCITAPASDDPIVGIWESLNSRTTQEGGSLDSITFVVNADGTAYSLGNFAGELFAGTLDFTWENAGEGRYLITIGDPKGFEDLSEPAIFELRDGKLVFTSPEGELPFVRVALEDYAVGLWTGIRGDYKEYNDIQVLFYLGENGKGHTVVYGPEVLNMEDIFTAEFTWKAEGDKVVITGEQGLNIDLPLVNGELIFSGLYPLHKYTVEDNLYGLWQSVEPVVEDGVSYDIVHLIKSDGTGTEIWTVPGSDAASKKYTFTWKMIDATTYKAVYDDGEVWLFEVVDAQLYDGETWYNKVGFDVLQDYALNKGA